MIDGPLHGLRILVVEDEFLLAEDLRNHLMDAGAVVVGPAASTNDAIGLIEKTEKMDGAIVDMNLGGHLASSVVDELRLAGIPVILTTGYDASSLPFRFLSLPRYEKPFDTGEIG